MESLVSWISYVVVESPGDVLVWCAGALASTFWLGVLWAGRRQAGEG